MARTLAALSLLLVTALPSFGLPEDRELPLSVSADSAVFDEIQGQATYSGNVVLTQGNLEIRADQLTATLVDGSVTEMTATGQPATFTDIPTAEQGQVNGMGERIAWTLAQQTMTLDGNAKLEQSTNVVSGERVVYRQDQGTLEASGNAEQRVQMTLTPSQP